MHFLLVMFGYRIKISHNLQKNNMSINDARNYAEKLARCIDQKTAHPIVVKKKSLKRFFSGVLFFFIYIVAAIVVSELFLPYILIYFKGYFYYFIPNGQEYPLKFMNERNLIILACFLYIIFSVIIYFIIRFGRNFTNRENLNSLGVILAFVSMLGAFYLQFVYCQYSSVNDMINSFMKSEDLSMQRLQHKMERYNLMIDMYNKKVDQLGGKLFFKSKIADIDHIIDYHNKGDEQITEYENYIDKFIAEYPLIADVPFYLLQYNNIGSYGPTLPFRQDRDSLIFFERLNMCEFVSSFFKSMDDEEITIIYLVIIKKIKECNKNEIRSFFYNYECGAFNRGQIFLKNKGGKYISLQEYILSRMMIWRDSLLNRKEYK